MKGNISGQVLGQWFAWIRCRRGFGVGAEEMRLPFLLVQREEVVSDPFRTRPSLSDSQTTPGELFDQYVKIISTLWSQVDKVINKHKGKNLSLSTQTFLSQLYLEI